MPRSSKYTKELLEPIVRESFSTAEMLKKLGLRLTGGNYRQIQQRVKAFELDTKHFLGQGWSKGSTQESNSSVAKVTRANTISDAEVFKKHSTYPPSKLGARLKKLKGFYLCEMCSLETWRGLPITLHVDHFDGDISNNEVTNLRFLCPNCHQQTSSWGRSK